MQQLTILIVDDSPEDRATYRRYLLQDSEYQYRILEEETAEGGLALCQSEQPNIILLDFLLPDLDGLEFLQELQQQSGDQPPVLMLTGQGDESIAVQAMKGGVQDYLIKGKTTSETLRLAVRSVIRNAQLQRELQQSQAALQQQMESERIVTQIALQIRQSLNLDEILNTTVELVRQFLKTDRVILFRLEPDGNGTVVVESVSPECISILSTSIYDSCLVESYIGPYLQGLVTAKTDIYTADLDPCHVNLLAQFQVRANLTVPILLNSAHKSQESGYYPSCPTPGLWGLLIAHHCAAPRQWQPLEIALLQQLATQVGIAIQQSQLYQAEQQMRAEAEAANRIKDEFLAVLSHQLRSPLNPILGWSKLLQTRKLDETRMAEALSIIERNAKLQAQLIEDLLDVSRILRGKLMLDIAPVDLKTPILAAIETVRLAAEAKSIGIQFPIPNCQLFIVGDGNRLQRVFWNLLSNAVKFTPNCGRVEINLSAVSEKAQNGSVSKPVEPAKLVTAIAALVS